MVYTLKLVSTNKPTVKHNLDVETCLTQCHDNYKTHWNIQSSDVDSNNALKYTEFRCR